VEAEDLVFDNCSQRQVVEQLSEDLPHVSISVFAEALVVEAVHLGDLSAFVVASQDGDSVAVTHLQGDQQSHRLHRVVATIHVVTHEEVVGVWGLASNFEKFFQVVELAVNITANCYGR